MKTRFLILALVWQIVAAQAAPIRVLTWDLSAKFQPGQAQEAAKLLKNSRPDVILLQHVTDWKTCQQIADALRPAVYHVATCSAWGDPRERSGRQAAILSKAKAYIAWSEPWQTGRQFQPAPGGFCFAAIRIGGTNVGIFSVEPGDDASGTEGRQLAEKVASLEKWNVNRLQAFVAGGDFTSAPDAARLKQAGFENAFANPPLYVLTRGAGEVVPPLVHRAPRFKHDAVICEIDPGAPKSVPAASPPIADAESAPAKTVGMLEWLGGTLVAGVALFVFAWMMFRRSTARPVSPRLLDLNSKTSATTANLSTGQLTVVTQPEGPIPDAVREGVIAELSQWLKQKLTRRLLSDRAQLLATQEVAKLKVMAVDERLTKVEQHIQQRNEDYERRIDVLLKALVNAEEENRELIRAQIAFLKSEMEKSRVRPTGDGREEY